MTIYMMMRCIVVSIAIVVLALAQVSQAADLKNNFYKKLCPSVESVVKDAVEKHVAKDPRIPARLLRMQFHDCFVRGCDGSVLLNSTSNNKAEKQAIPNLTLRGFDVIDDIKAQVEKKCPGVVSCADILALAARDAVVAGSGGPSWRVRTGRRDGVISRKIEASQQIPAPTFNFSQLKTSFASKGLSVEDLVVLSGGHTIGVGHCNFFSNRLYNFTGKGDMDPSLDASYAEQLKTKCKSLADNTTSVVMDPGSPLTFDSDYYTNLKANRGLFQSDAALLTDSISRKYIAKQASGTMRFSVNFKKSMEQLNEIVELTAPAGEIRRNCAFVN